MSFPAREWSIDDLFVLSQYPEKTLAQIASEVKAATTTVRRELLRMGKKMHKSGRGARTVAPGTPSE